MRRTWNVFLATLSLVCFSWGPAAPSVARADFPPLAEALYHRAVQVCPFGELAQVQLLLPAAPQATAATLAADVGASSDLGWYHAAATPSYEVDPFIYGYEYDYDYSHGDYSYRALLNLDSTTHEVTADENFESHYGYDAAGRSLKPAPELAAAGGSSDGYEPYYGYDESGRPLPKWLAFNNALFDDYFANDFFRPAPRTLDQRLAAGVAAAAAFDWQSQIAALVDRVVASDVAQHATEQATLAWQAAVDRAAGPSLGQNDFDYADWDSYDQFDGDYDAAWQEEVETVAADWQSVRELARTLDRAGAKLQAWSRLLNDYASRVEQGDTLQTRRPALIEAR